MKCVHVEKHKATLVCGEDKPVRFASCIECFAEMFKERMKGDKFSLVIEVSNGDLLKVQGERIRPMELNARELGGVLKFLESQGQMDDDDDA